MHTPRYHWFLLLLVCWAAPAQAEPGATQQQFQPGETYFGHDQHIEYIAGDLPFILSAPHGGREKPEGIVDRKEGTFAFDIGTQELARAIAAEMHQQTGHWPHIIICRISRRKIDCNREIVEACAGNPAAEKIWHDWHRFLTAARDRVVQDFGRGLYIDLHGHGHKIGQLEMGYLHSQLDYDVSNEQLSAPQNVTASSLQAIAALNRRPYADLVRGDFALGTLLMDRGFPATPSKQRPVPTIPYFRGGYNTGRYGRDAAPLAGLQIETNSRGVRDNDKSRAAFAKALTDSLKIYFEAQIGLPLAAKSTPAVSAPVTNALCAPQPACCRRRFRCRARCR
ncbi:N-formylglutamate amidohydrolase [Anatilimnocola aggregata]|uniref:N-formylglutamate amidohydrolase n=2 Tax=Anatilimnocola aggregata TaxID=2528021 RepID=A0A517Y744_9BACT|nr:N-formylglutamate amidohydrolase [Anatilimnocola aggregata]